MNNSLEYFDDRVFDNTLNRVFIEEKQNDRYAIC